MPREVRMDWFELQRALGLTLNITHEYSKLVCAMQVEFGSDGTV